MTIRPVPLPHGCLTYCSGTGTSNWPLRGGKHTLWEGGVRGTALAFGAGIEAPMRGARYQNLMHVSDVLPTILEVFATMNKLESPSHLCALIRGVRNGRQPGWESGGWDWGYRWTG